MGSGTYSPSRDGGSSTSSGRGSTPYVKTTKLRFVFRPDDPGFADIDAQHAAGRNIVKLWADYREKRRGAALSLKTFYSRFAAWRTAGKPPQLKPNAMVESRKPRRDPRSLAETRGFSLTRGGLAFVDVAGAALQVRHHALCLRMPDGNEHLWHASDHRLRCVILAASASITSDAVQWACAEHVGLLIANKSLTAFSLFASEPVVNTTANALQRRRAQSAADPLRVARHIVKLKIENMHSVDERTVHIARLQHARTVDDVIAIEAVASGAYWKKYKGFELRFADKNVPPSWGLFIARGSGKRLKHSARTSLFHSNRDAIDPMNAMLSYGYAVALSQMVRAIIGLGFDPCFGCLHSDKYGRVSFGYDCLELLRVGIDAIVFNLAAARRFRRGEFVVTDRSHGRLGPPLARDVASAVLKGATFHEFETAVMAVAREF